MIADRLIAAQEGTEIGAGSAGAIDCIGAGCSSPLIAASQDSRPRNEPDKQWARNPEPEPSPRTGVAVWADLQGEQHEARYDICDRYARWRVARGDRQYGICGHRLLR